MHFSIYSWISGYSLAFFALKNPYQLQKMCWCLWMTNHIPYPKKCNKFHPVIECETGILMKELKNYKWWRPSLPVTFIKCHVLSLTKFSEKIWNQNKPAPHIEVPLHKTGDITHFLADVTVSHPFKMEHDRYMKLGPKRRSWIIIGCWGSFNNKKNTCLDFWNSYMKFPRDHTNLHNANWCEPH